MFLMFFWYLILTVSCLETACGFDFVISTRRFTLSPTAPFPWQVTQRRDFAQVLGCFLLFLLLKMNWGQASKEAIFFLYTCKRLAFRHWR